MRDLFSPLLFLYFATLHADKLGLNWAGFNIRVNNLIALFLVPLFFFRLKDQLFSIHKRMWLALFFLTLSITASALLSPYKERCLFFFGWYLFTVICYMLFPYLLVRHWNKAQLLSLYTLSFIVVGLYALLQWLLSYAGIQDPFAHQRLIAGIVRPNAFAYEPSFYALYLSPFVMMCNYHYLVLSHQPFFSLGILNRKKIVFINLLFLISFATSALFAYAVFIALFLLAPQLNQYKKRVMKLLFVLGSLLATLALFFPQLVRLYLFKSALTSLQTQASFYERWGGIVNAWRLFLKFPLFGVGLGGYAPFLRDAWLEGDKNFLFFSANFQSLESTPHLLKLFEPANVLTEALASLGLCGFCSLAFLMFTLFHLAKKALFSQKYDSQPYHTLFNYLLSSLVLLIVLQINQGLLRTYVWVHVAMTFAILEEGTLHVEQCREASGELAG